MNCYKCDKEMKEMHGTFHFEPPPNVPGGPMIVENTDWLQCECGEQMLTAKLSQELEAIAAQRGVYEL